jgi:hemoglobin-like flavoprotein
MTTPAASIEHTLELVAARVGDPAPMVYARLFAQAPELEALFVNDRSGAVRAEMFLKSIDVIQDLVGESHYAQSLVATEWINHRNLGVPMAHFGLFFQSVVASFREALGSEWTPEIDLAWSGALDRLQAVIDTAASEAA